MQKAYSYMSALIYVTRSNPYSEFTLFYSIRFLFIVFSRKCRSYTKCSHANMIAYKKHVRPAGFIHARSLIRNNERQPNHIN